MSNISESIPDLLGGVSQVAPQRREVNEVESMVNCQLRPAEGVVKRPPTTWIAEVSATSSAYTGAAIHPINKNADERFWVIVLDGDLKVFNATTGVEVTVTFPDGKTYLDVAGTPNEKFRLATFNDTTVIVNREIVVDQAAEVSSSRGREAFVSVNQTDFDTDYFISVVFSGAPYLSQNASRIADHTIPGPAAGGTVLNTTVVAQALADEIETGFMGSGSLNLLTATVIGSGVHITPGSALDPAFDFTITIEDGLGGQGMTLLQGAIQSTEELPAEAPVGFIIKVEGNAEKTLDDVFYEFTDSGAWNERAQDGIPIALDPTTLPLELIANPDFTTQAAVVQVPTALSIPGPVTTFFAPLLETQDGTASTAATRQLSPAPGVTEQKFYNLASSAGGDTRFIFDALIDTTKLVGGGLNPKNPGGASVLGDIITWQVAYNVGAGWVTLSSEPLTWQPIARQLTFAVDIPLAVAGTDIRIQLVSNAANLGSASLTPALSGRYSAQVSERLTFQTSHYAPNTVLSATINGTAWSHTFTAGGTRAALLAELKTDIEAYGGAAVSVTTAEDSFSGSLDITNDDGTLPTLTSFVFDDGLTLTTQAFSGTIDFTTLGLNVGNVVTNTTDSSSAQITVITARVLTTGALAGGVNNVWADGNALSITKASTEFICRQPEWAKRLVGTLETNEWPAYKGSLINEVAFLKNRLVMLSNENVVMSEVDKFFNFFRSSTIDILDSDRIDVSLSGNKAAELHSAFTWNETLLTWSELGQFVVNGEPFLSPNTVRREATTAYLNTRKVRPVTSERAVYFLTEGNEFCQLWDYKPTSDDATSAEGNRLSAKVPRYMPGAPRALLAVSDPEMVLVLSTTDLEKLYVYTHFTQDQQTLLGGWHEWSFTGVTQILGMGAIDNEVSLLVVRDDDKVHLEVMDLWALDDFTVDAKTESDDHAVAPTFGASASITRTKDIFTEASDAKLTDHTPAPTTVGAWLVPAAFDLIGAGGMYVEASSNKARADTVSGISVPGCRINWADTYLAANGTDTEVWADFSWSGYADINGELLVHLLAGSTNLAAGLRLRVVANNTTHVKITVDASFTDGETSSFTPPTSDAVSGLITVAEARSHGGDITTQVRYGMRTVGDILTVFAADAGTGANEVNLYTGTLLSTWKTEFRDGTYSYHGMKPEATADETVFLDNFEFASGGSTVGTTYTTFLGDTAFVDLVAIEPDGTETPLTNNGDGTATFPTEDKTAVNMVIGIPVTSTIELTQLYHRKNFGAQAGSAETRGNTYISSLLLGLEETTEMVIAVAITGHVSFSQDLTEVRSLDGEYMHCRVGGRNTEVTLTLTSSSAANFKIVGLDWDGVYHNRTRRMS